MVPLDDKIVIKYFLKPPFSLPFQTAKLCSSPDLSATHVPSFSMSFSPSQYDLLSLSSLGSVSLQAASTASYSFLSVISAR